MKAMRKHLAIILSLAMVFSTCIEVSAFAAEDYDASVSDNTIVETFDDQAEETKNEIDGENCLECQEDDDYSYQEEGDGELASEELKVDANYNATSAIDYARNHMASNHTSGSSSCPNGWLCAEFVSKCCQAGGMGNANKAGCRGLFTELSKYGTPYTLAIESDGKIKNSGSNAGKLAPGDVIITYCKSHDLYLHAVLVSGFNSSGYVLNYAHNSNKRNEVLTASKYCSKKGGNESYSNITVYVVHFPQPAPDLPAPEITDVYVSNCDNTGYTVNCVVKSSAGLTNVEFPTWTSNNGQDDLANPWPKPSMSVKSVNNGIVTYWDCSYRVKVSEHNNEGGWYNTHIYAWDKAGKYNCYALSEYIDRTKPTISNVKVSDVTADGYTVSCTVTDGSGISRVQFPTWTEDYGQDDLVGDWSTNASCSGTKNGNTYTFRVNKSLHKNETGKYITHIYAYDTFGNVEFASTSVNKLVNPAPASKPQESNTGTTGSSTGSTGTNSSGSTTTKKVIKGKCQMPYNGRGGGYLIGIETYSNPNQSYKYEMLILDCTLLARGKAAWIYTTGQTSVKSGNALWTVWQPKYGYYWTLFRVYDASGKKIDEECYGFKNI